MPDHRINRASDGIVEWQIAAKELQDVDSLWEGGLREAWSQKEKQNLGPWRNLKPLVSMATVNVKHSPTTRQININPHTEVLFTSLPISKYNISSFQ